MSDTLLFERTAAVGTISLNQPKELNAVNLTLWGRLA